MKLNITCHSRQFLFDTISPTSAYLAVRNLFPGSVLLESTEFSSSREGKSIIGFDLISRLSVKENAMRILFPGKPEILTPIHDEFPLNCVSNYLESFKTINSDGVTNGFFVFHSFETFAAYESPDAGLNRFSDPHIPLLEYRLFRYVLTFNHYNGKAVLVQNCLSGEEPDLDSVCTTIFSEKGSDFPVFVSSEEQPDCLKEEFLEKVKTCQQMIRKGEIFQAVISRGFSRKFRGDDFRLYRALRVVNPSPYMFYFDFDSFKIFGSSPEAQIRVDGREATLRPIAGTIARTHNAETDTLLEKGLLSDPKENAEHAMLVDLARNDLNRNCRNVSVKELKKVVRFSHVSHLESEVAGTIPGSIFFWILSRQEL
jgi:anthranilate synthase component I